ncbi:DUF6263 family protein [Costertonia aggregata]|uniref:Uncharacterized protein n=1 Tax=Costertonia aggregata TaxID=343403 RepID=A0A7H9AKB3_9FLAO|nr:DUF6263 family protein [Costertonia aggregata]QLG43931.1 hypothetical protein HYG79_00735 [Costertonia aggregata]
MKYFFQFTILLLCSFFGFGQTVLQYNLKESDVFEIKQNAQQIITQELDGAAHTITNDINGILAFMVTQVNENGYTISLTFKDLNLKMTSSIQGELMNVNAKEVKEGDMQSKIFNSLLDIPVQIALSKTGDILNVKGGDSLVNKMAKASGLEDEFSLNMMKKSLEKEFGSEALSNSYEQMTFIYPEKEIKEGDSWKNVYSGKLKAENTWTLDELTGENAKISGVATITMDVTEPATTMKLSGSQNTSIVTNLASGFVKSMVVSGTSKGVSTMAQMGDQEIPTTIDSKITYELINR